MIYNKWIKVPNNLYNQPESSILQLISRNRILNDMISDLKMYLVLHSNVPSTTQISQPRFVCCISIALTDADWKGQAMLSRLYSRIGHYVALISKVLDSQEETMSHSGIAIYIYVVLRRNMMYKQSMST